MIEFKESGHKTDYANLEDLHYYSIPAVSNSALKEINPEQGGSPAKFKKVVLDRDIEYEPNPSFENGKIIHKYVEDPKNFVISDFTKPTETMALWVERVFNNLPSVITVDNFLISEEIIKKIALEEREGAYKSMKDDTVTAKFWKEGAEYINYLFIERSDKIILNQQQLNMMDFIIESINNNPEAYRLLFKEPDFKENVAAYNEKAIYWTKKVDKRLNLEYIVSMNMKALVDRFKLNFVSKDRIVVDLIDFKTTSSTVANFKYSFKKYRYYRQLAVYKEAITEFIVQAYILKGAVSADVKIEFNNYIVAVETTGLYQCKVFKITDKYIEKGEEEYDRLLKMIAYHKGSGQWSKTEEEVLNGYEVLDFEE